MFPEKLKQVAKKFKYFSVDYKPSYTEKFEEGSYTASSMEIRYHHRPDINYNEVRYGRIRNHLKVISQWVMKTKNVGSQTSNSAFKVAVD